MAPCGARTTICQRSIPPEVRLHAEPRLGKLPPELPGTRRRRRRRPQVKADANARAARVDGCTISFNQPVAHPRAVLSEHPRAILSAHPRAGTPGEQPPDAELLISGAAAVPGLRLRRSSSACTCLSRSLRETAGCA
jgi:hypothetical protein